MMTLETFGLFMSDLFIYVNSSINIIFIYEILSNEMTIKSNQLCHKLLQLPTFNLCEVFELCIFTLFT